MATKKETAEKWLDITKRALAESLAKEGVGGSGDLKGSITGKVNPSGPDDVKSVEIQYNFYGKFVDMGVGRKSQDGGFGKRTAKEWYSSVINRRVWELSTLMINQHGAEAVAKITAALPGKVEISM